MIIKLIPIKTKARLATIINYIATDKGRIEDYKNQGVFHNVQSIQLEDLRKEFEYNYDEYAGKRRNGNIAMHIIQSVSPLDKDTMSLEMMDDITSTFLNKAYPNALAFGTHHKEQSHLHTHTIVSANEFMSKTSTRLSKEKLFETHKFMLDHIHEKYPELKTTIDISTWGKKLNNEKEYYMKKRNPNLKLTKEELQDKVQDIFRTCESSKQFFALLEFDGFKTYNYKDRVQGIYSGDDNKKMRFSRLGIEQEHIEAIDKQYERMLELKDMQKPGNKITLDRYQFEALMEEREYEIEKSDPQLDEEVKKILGYPIRETENGTEIDDAFYVDFKDEIEKDSLLRDSDVMNKNTDKKQDKEIEL